MMFKGSPVRDLVKFVKLIINVLMRFCLRERFCYIDNKYSALAQITKFSKVLNFYRFFGTEALTTSDAVVWRLSYIVFILRASRLANGLEIATLLSALAGATVKPSADATPAAGGIITFNP